MQKKRFSVTGMHCAACAAQVERAAAAVAGVERAEVNLLAGAMVVTYDEARAGPEALGEAVCAAVAAAGYGAACEGAGRACAPAPDAGEAASLRRRLAASAVLCLALLALAMGPMAGLSAACLSGRNAAAGGLAQLLLAAAIA
ncbi:MAG: cation transporter, partial [Duodenibacillus sp.]|nr:cation transporter [Duodenibacillus sp.]